MVSKLSNPNTSSFVVKDKWDPDLLLGRRNTKQIMDMADNMFKSKTPETL